MRFNIDKGRLKLQIKPFEVYCGNCEKEMDYTGNCSRMSESWEQTKLVHYWNCWDCGKAEQIDFEDLEFYEDMSKMERFKHFTGVKNDAEAKLKMMLDEV